MTRQNVLLKRGIIKGSDYILHSKNTAYLRRKKWLLFLKTRQEVSCLFRNDIFLMHHKMVDLRKNYAAKMLFKQRFFAYFSTLKNRTLKKMLRSSRVFSYGGALDFIELRLDMLLFRINFVKSLCHAKCLIHSKLVRVNDVLITSPSFTLEVGDLIELQVTHNAFSRVSLNFPVPFAEVNHETFSAVVLNAPSERSLAQFTFFYSFFIGLFEVKYFQDFK